MPSTFTRCCPRLGVARVAAGLIGALLLSASVSAEPETTGPGISAPVSPADIAETLLDQLAAAEDEATARALETRVREIWQRSGSDTADLLLGRAGSAFEREDYARALQYLDTIVALRPDFVEAWNMRATVYYMLDEYDLSMSDIERVLSLQPRHFGALSGLGMIFRELNQPREALEAFRRALAVNPFLENARTSVDRLEVEVEGRPI
jgi:tetratricopeptide (TPR) repeat protein